MAERFPFTKQGGVWDPRGYRRAYEPQPPADELQLQRVLRKVGRDTTQLADIYNELTARNLPPQLVQSSWFAVVTANNSPQRLLQKNPKRMSWLVSGTTSGNWGWSYDYPDAQLVNAAQVLMGVQQAATTSFSEANGSVSINEIWVWTINEGIGFPQVFIGYEGVLASVGNDLP